MVDPWELYEKIMNEDKCKKCFREINDNIKTKDGCIWCDYKYWRNKDG